MDPDLLPTNGFVYIGAGGGIGIAIGGQQPAAAAAAIASQHAHIAGSMVLPSVAELLASQRVSRRDKPVAAAAHRRHVSGGCRVITELAAQPTDVRLDERPTDRT